MNSGAAWLAARYSWAGAEIVVGLTLATWGGYVVWRGADVIDDLPFYALFGRIWGLQSWATTLMWWGLVQALVGPSVGRRSIRGFVAFALAFFTGGVANAFRLAPGLNTIWIIFASISAFETLTALYFMALWFARRRGLHVP